MSFFISSAVAASSEVQPSQAGGSFSFILMLAMFALLYFMIIRPQTKKAKETRSMLEKIKKGDEVVTSGGMYGKVLEVKDNSLLLNVARDVDVSITRNSVSSVVPKGTIKSL